MQYIGRRILEQAFPYHAEAQLSNADLQINERTISALQSGEACTNGSPIQLLTGSRVEGFGLSDDYTHERPDLDVMFLYGGNWCVRVPNMYGSNARNENTGKTYREMDTEGCGPAYCRICVKSTGEMPPPPKRIPYPDIANGHRTLKMFLLWSLHTLCGILGLWYFPHNVTIKCLSLQIFIIPSGVLLIVLLARLGPSQRLFVPWNGKIMLSPKAFVQRVSKSSFLDTNIHIQGPSMEHTHPLHITPVDHYDLVPALICLQPFSCIKQFLVRERTCSVWPSPSDLDQIATMPGLLVPTGRKGSPNIDTEWRYSFSVQEIYLSRRMPLWVKAGYRAFKYTLKHLSHVLRVSLEYTDEEVLYQDASVEELINRMTSTYGKYRTELELSNWGFRGNIANENESCFCSYHMKTILLWSLEDPETWQHCPFRLMLRLLRQLEDHLISGILPHYFNGDCNLFANVSGKELVLIRACVVEILNDPIAAICHTAVIPDISNHDRVAATCHTTIIPDISRKLTDVPISRMKQVIIRRRKVYTVASFIIPGVLLLTYHYFLRKSYLLLFTARDVHI